MGVLKYRPEFPVIHQSPGLGLLFRSMNLSDYGYWAGLTAVAFPAGYFSATGLPALRNRFMWFAVAVGTTAGLTAGILRSGGRLLGLKPNADLVKQYKYRQDFTDYQVRTEPFRIITEEEQQEIFDNPRY